MQFSLLSSVEYLLHGWKWYCDENVSICDILAGLLLLSLSSSLEAFILFQAESFFFQAVPSQGTNCRNCNWFHDIGRNITLNKYFVLCTLTCFVTVRCTVPCIVPCNIRFTVPYSVHCTVPSNVHCAGTLLYCLELLK